MRQLRYRVPSAGQGRRWSEAAGLGNVRHLLLDILDAADGLDGPFDYIVAHGIYAWVPDHVRTAVMPLITRLLAPNGIAFVSYNAMPGGYSRVAVRAMMMHHVRHLSLPTARLAAARALLRTFTAAATAEDQPITAAMRREAEAALAQSDGQFFHDILNACYAPQSLLEVAADAADHGLRYLGDARGGGLDKGFVDPARATITDTALIDRLQAMDYASGRYFRTSLFVRAELPFSRVVDSAAARADWVSTQAREIAPGRFGVGGRTIHIANGARADMLRRLIARRGDAPLAREIAATPDQLGALCHYALEGVIELSTVAPPFGSVPGERPCASPLARSQAAENGGRVVTLDHHWTELDDDMAALICLLDGSRDLAQLARSLGLDEDSTMHILRRLAAAALIRA